MLCVERRHRDRRRPGAAGDRGWSEGLAGTIHSRPGGASLMSVDTRGATVADVRASLAELAYLQRGCAFVCARRVVAVADLATKTLFARHAAADMASAAALRRRVQALGYSMTSAVHVSQGHHDLMQE